MDKLSPVSSAHRYASLNSPNRKKTSSFRKMKQMFSRNRKSAKKNTSTSTATNGSSKSLKASSLFQQEDERLPDLQMSFHSSYNSRCTVEEDEQQQQFFGDPFYNPEKTETTTTPLDSIQESLSSGFPVETVEFPRIPSDKEDNENSPNVIPPFSPKKNNNVALFSPTPKDQQQQHEGSQQTDSLTTDDYSSSADDDLASPPSVRLRSESPSSSLTSNELPLILDEEEDGHDAAQVLQQQLLSKPCLEDHNHNQYKNDKAELIHVSKNLLTDFDDLAAMVEAEAAAASTSEKQQEPLYEEDTASRYTQHVLLMEYESQRKSKQHQRYKALRHEWKIYQGFLQRRYKKLCKGEQFVSEKRFSTIPQDHSTRGTHVVESTLRDAKRVGEQLKTKLKSMEDQVAQTWSLYENLITTDNVHSQDQHPICEDEWMLEFQYCTQVQHQLNLWNTTLTELSTMFHLVRHELSMYQEELFVLFDQQKISKSIALAYLGAESQEEKDQGHNIFSDLKSNTDDSTTANNGVVPVSPPSPLRSPLLESCKIMERRNGSDDEGWTDTLAIVTADSVLHFFDIPSGEQESTKSPQEIMDEIMLTSSSSEASLLSIYLPNCSHCHKVRTINSAHGEDLEIIEAYLDANRCFTTRKTLLRTASSKDTMEWSHNVFVTY
mmetsp:Transcript_7037/g.10072  ORF Transcript_7037/g.10072 Transcript_7037/m.10072 type:complete len:663 (-) Transcript_7037:251-2239(-)